MRKKKLLDFISRGEEIKRKVDLRRKTAAKDGLILTGSIDDIEFKQWMNEIKIYANMYLKMHSLYKDIINTIFLNRESALSEMLGYLKALLTDDSFFYDDMKECTDKKNERLSFKDRILFAFYKEYKKDAPDMTQAISLEDLNTTFIDVLPVMNKLQNDGMIKNLIIKYDGKGDIFLGSWNKVMVTDLGQKYVYENILSIKEGGEKKLHEINDMPVIFLSHKSDDKKYGDALATLIRDLGIKENQLIYTSHELHGIPLNQNIYEYLKSRFKNDMLMIYLLSDKYFDSSPCLNEMGAAWVIQSEYISFFVPNFNFQNKKFIDCALDIKKIGIDLGCKQRIETLMTDFKDKVLKLFPSEVSEKKWLYLLKNFITAIT